ncbi:MAG: magnesium/cobalt transporter CorA [Verrucomicrobiae bacterium]|nr:magnesium/cobalt transporter CorA [Verrucomicrobiae bacterium]
MLRSRYHAPGAPPGTLASPPQASKPVLTLIEYDRETFEERALDTIDDALPSRDGARVRWINVAGLGDADLLRRLGERFGLHPLALEDVLHVGQRPKLEAYSDHLFMVTWMMYFDDDRQLVFEQVSMFLGKGFLITVLEDPGDVFEPVRERLRHGRGFARSRGHDYLAYALLDAVVDQVFPVLESLGESLEQLEDELLERPTRGCLLELHDLKRTLLQLRRTAWPQRDLLNALSRDDTGLIDRGTHVFLRDCYDHAIRSLEMIEGYRELTAGLNDLYLSSVSHRTNEIIRVLTVVTTIFIPLTFIAGVYGMNFDIMPELRQPWGYFACVGLMATIAGGLLVVFRKKGWI